MMPARCPHGAHWEQAVLFLFFFCSVTFLCRYICLYVEVNHFLPTRSLKKNIYIYACIYILIELTSVTSQDKEWDYGFGGGVVGVVCAEGDVFEAIIVGLAGCCNGRNADPKLGFNWNAGTHGFGQ